MTRLHAHKHLKRHRTLTAQKKYKPKLVDRATYMAAIIEPVITIPQVMIIFRTQNASSISLMSWIGYEILTAIWVWYGFVHKDKLILLYQGLFLIVQGAVIIGAIMYGAPLW
jgi:uncharacterized protein with PQ loop repeat